MVKKDNSQDYIKIGNSRPCVLDVYQSTSYLKHDFWLFKK